MKKPRLTRDIRYLLVLMVILFSACDDNSSVASDDGTTMVISGRVTDSTGGAGNIQVCLTGSDITSQIITDSNGNYTFTGLEQGTYRITPYSDHYNFNPVYSDITLDETARDQVDFHATEVTDPDDPSTPGDDDTVTLMFAGDINLATKVGETVEANGGDYIFPFVYIAEYINSFDCAFANLESIISDLGETTKPVTGVDLRADPDAVYGLKEAGFDIVSVANNHTGDFGEEGMTDSYARLQAAGIGFAGGGLNRSEARAPYTTEVKGVRIACLSYTNVPMYMDSLWMGQVATSRWLATDDRPGIAWAHDTRFASFGDLDEMEDDITAATADADIVVVMVHFGWEYEYEPDEAQIDLAHRAVDAGADFVIGHHPHVTQRTETYNGGFIAYSLGNFVFDISEEMAVGTTRGMIVEATVTDGVVTDVVTRYSRINSLYQVTLEE